MAKYRKKPVVVHAEQFHIGGNPEEWPEGVKWGGDRGAGGAGCYVVTTAHGHDTPIADRDWIITEPDGRGHYPCKPDIFEQTYEPHRGD